MAKRALATSKTACQVPLVSAMDSMTVTMSGIAGAMGSTTEFSWQ